MSIDHPAPSGPPPSPPTDRVVRVLELLAAAPDRPTSLSEIHEALDISLGTLHPLLATLTQAGFLLRVDERSKRYQLGPRLLMVGLAATHTAPAHLAHHEMQSLTDQTELTCIAVAPSGPDLVIIDRTSTARTPDPATEVGRRFPFAAPLGIPLVAWQSDVERDRWFDDAPVAIDEERRTDYDVLFAQIRARGYGIESLSAEEMRTRQALADLTWDALSPRVTAMLRDVVDELTVTDHSLGLADPDDVVRVNVVYAPVFGPAGVPVLHLSLHLLRDAIPFREVAAYGELLVDATRRITNASGGRVPPAR